MPFLALFGQSYAQSPYDSGYDHGCGDADTPNPARQYINQPQKGPSFHSEEFMEGYNDGYGDCQDPTINDNNGLELPPPDSVSSPTPNTDDEVSIFRSIFETPSAVFGITILFLIVLAAIAIRVKKGNKKSKERKGFSQSVQQAVLRKQDHKCAHCKRLLNVVDYDHKNGDRSDNRESNCQALCPNCHAVKTRREKNKRW
ncbi:MAG: HNH endonuclease [Candidatus Nitrosocosmicus sp.]